MAPTESGWLVIFLLDVQDLRFTRDPFTIGGFEVARSREPFDPIEVALAESAALFHDILEPSTFRIRQLLEAESGLGALRLGWLRAKEALSLLSLASTSPLGMTLLQPGCAVNVDSGETEIARPQQGVGPDLVVCDQVALHPAQTLGDLATLPEAFGELGNAIRRSAHWTTLAAQADDLGEQLLLQWIAGEAIAKMHEDDDVVPRLLSAMGILTSHFFAEVSPAETSSLRCDPDFLHWQPRLLSSFQACRDQRNKIVHAGFRELEMSASLNAEDFRMLSRAIPRAVRSVQRLALDGLVLGLRTRGEVWRDFAHLKARFRQGSALDEALATITAIKNGQSTYATQVGVDT
jgi:hypothetical protein